MNKYAGWQAVYMSFFSTDLYRDVTKNWKGVGYLYLFLLVFGCWILIAIGAQIAIAGAIKTYFQPIVDQWPSLKIHNSEFSIDKKSPYMINVAGGAFVIDFDTSDKPVFPSDKIGFEITKTQVIQVLGQGDPDTNSKTIVDLKQLAAQSSSGTPADMTFDRPALQNIVDMFKNWFGTVVFCVAAPLMLMFCMIQTLVYGGIGMLVSSNMNLGLTYGQAVRISAVALTPGLLIESLVKASGHEIPLWGLISIALAITYVVLGVRSNQTSSSNQPPADTQNPPPADTPNPQPV